jgi:hypothetical protein
VKSVFAFLGLTFAALLIAVLILLVIVGLSDWPGDPPCEAWSIAPCREMQE